MDISIDSLCKVSDVGESEIKLRVLCRVKMVNQSEKVGKGNIWVIHHFILITMAKFIQSSGATLGKVEKKKYDKGDQCHLDENFNILTLSTFAFIFFKTFIALMNCT